MRFPIILAGLAASAVAQGVSVGIAPTAAAPAGCKPTFAGRFTINVQDISFGVKEASSQILASAVTVTLADGVLHDSLNRIGAIVANHQFQFDGPPQAGSIYTGGWSACANDSLALGGSAIFYACTSGTFRNLYDETQGAQCSPINIIIVPVDKAAATTSVSKAATTDSSSSSSASASKTSASKSSSASKTESASSSTITVSSVLKNSTVVTSVKSNSGSILVATTLSSLTTGGSTATPTGASAAAAASSTVSTGAAMATAIARDLLGAAVGAFGAAIMLF
ncbi:uncharacterized protein BDZ99DRAFT_476849 [Mytilinidion resinicola]|uniref:Cell wall mannoprotein PIR1-like C-terminal domain-containing protein n=1 Tax=Mytilinidion resinicola TaxID=574789 RepID=A0A6A6YKS4_9PEZI|nr:uncharacterized protein BDZ99DRAFT_476849 [Mytilinidion resinicola]KAF2809421.1 hypothetical protein BDZ99DRAFT_476849 [Mytilinidion resinicola]